MLSIVIPVYNAARCLDKCLLSIQMQTFGDFEAIIVDDGSKDNSGLIAQKWCQKDSRFILISQENRGVSVARNVGIEHSVGECVCFVDADDYVDKYYLEKLYSVYHKGTLSICNFVYNEGTNVLQCAWKKNDIIFDQNFVKDFLILPLGNNIAYSPCNKLFDNNLLHCEKIRFPTNVAVGEDMIFVLNYLSKIKTMYYTDDGLYHYCIEGDSAMRGGKDYLPLYETTLQCLKNNLFGNVNIEDETLNLWSRKTLTLILTSSFVTQMRYDSFRKYYKRLNESELFNRVKKVPLDNDLKKNALVLAARFNSSILLYGIVKLNAYRGCKA